MPRHILPKHPLGTAANLLYEMPAVRQGQSGADQQLRGSPVDGVVAKVARLAVSKAAAFSYAVAVGVAGHFAVNFFQAHEPPAPATATAAIISHAAPATDHPRPAAAVAAPVLPEPSLAVSLPNPSALPAPALKPAVLPSEHVAAAPPVHPMEPPPAVHADPGTASAGLVSAPPEPAKPADQPQGQPGFQFSDIWHPGEALHKGLGWAGDQIPDFGSDRPPSAAARVLAHPSAPIPLLPAGTPIGGAETARASEAPAKPSAPGPGSGGLY
jgi:hypothetical protein